MASIRPEPWTVWKNAGDRRQERTGLPLRFWFGLWLLLIVVLASAVPLAAQKFYDINKYIENPRMVAENQEPTHVPLMPFPNQELAIEDNWSRSPFYLSLDGIWKFYWSPNPAEAPEEFYQENFDVSHWDDISVPSVWQMQGYDHIIYRNIPQEFTPYNPPYVPDELNPVGCYKRTFMLPENWKDRQVFLHFERVQSASFVWVDGKYVRYDESAMTPAEYNITPYVRPGENSVAVKVIRWSDGSYLECQDMWRFSGIYRSVYLFSTPQVHIRDFFVKTDLDKDYKDATLIISAEVKNYSPKDMGTYTVQAELFDAERRSVGTFKATAKVRASEKVVVKLQKDVRNPFKWSAEKPYLYTLTLELVGPDGKTTEVLSEKIGFRKLEIKNGQALVNGVAIDFKGVNRHEHHPDYGRTMTSEMMKKDIELMKRFNVNAVRTSHYPNDPEWYELCDQYGIYVQDEVNAECHHSEWINDLISQQPGWEDAFMDRFTRMIQRDKNHPCVVMWSTGNECGLGFVHYLMADYAREADGTRFL
ncbi:MAG: beta-galactosidase, partial [candidate division KSB1 bacterium]|nr:beta-galactosidase [candidate division KSB1 bacterium]